MSKPIIGITANLQSSTPDVSAGFKRVSVSNAYVVSVILGGGIPAVLPVTDDRSVIEPLLSGVDGVLITGGADVNPLLYGEEPWPKQGSFSPERDRCDMLVIRTAFRMHKPILGICRGIQVLNVAFGGTLYQDVSLIDGACLKHYQEAESGCASHTVAFTPESRLSGLWGDSIQTNSFHHQAVRKPGEGFLPVAFAKDGVIEAIERTGDGFILGVQWHPELMTAAGDDDMRKFFALFADICEENARRP